MGNFTPQQIEAFKLLNQLRAAGTMNMLGAAPWLANQLGHHINDARRLHREWLHAVNDGDWNVYTGVRNAKRT